MLYVCGFLLGLGYALFLPAQSVIVPRLVPEGRLQTGNAIIQGTTQLALFIGPVTAGLLIRLLAHTGTAAARVPQASGIALVFALDAAGFLVSAITLALIASPLVRRDRSRHVVRSSVLRSLGGGIADVWRDKTLRLYFVLIGAVNLALLGPLSVGVPVLAHTRFSGGAFAYGAVLLGLGAGALAGVVAGGVLRRPLGRAFAAAMLGSTVLLGVGLAMLGALPSAGSAVGATFLIGLAEGYLIVQFITWIQVRTSRPQLGRMMSILLVISIGQAPLSNLLAGVLMKFSVSLVMIAAGSLIVLVAVTAAFSPSVWQFSENCARPAGAGER
jgi:hypothetical protein